MIGQLPTAEFLGFSTSSAHSVNGDIHSSFGSTVPHKFVSLLLRRYPEGKVFNFDSKGDLVSSDSSDNSIRSRQTKRSPKPNKSISPETNPRRRWAREHEGANILKIFPGARSVVFSPVWDSKKERWFAASFSYTHMPARSFTLHREHSFVSGFGMLAMEQLHRHETMHSEKAKSDALSCISHELRSPLHGILLGVELLNDAGLNVFQNGVLHTLDACCHTLVDTVDHLLDFSNINRFTTTAKQRSIQITDRGMGAAGERVVEAGMMNLSSSIQLHQIVEEVIESVFAGSNFQQSINQASQAYGKSSREIGTSFGPVFMHDLIRDALPIRVKKASVEEVEVFLMVDPSCSWLFNAEAGAIRRIVMNLFGNALKYTQRGAIKVELSQKPPRDPSRGKIRHVLITVSDTGSGISREYLENHLFQPFTQENSLIPGTGLGLSLVKKITTHLRGRISVESTVGKGTTVSVSLPLRVESPPTTDQISAEDPGDSFIAQVQLLRGLRVRLLGFKNGTGAESRL